jgi:hypothetical protein
MFVTLRHLRKAYAALCEDDRAPVGARPRVVHLDGGGPSFELLTHGACGHWRYEGSLAIVEGDLAGQQGLDARTAEAPGLLEQLLMRTHGDRFAVALVRSVYGPVKGTAMVAEVTIVFAIPWLVLRTGEGAVLSHGSFELPMTSAQLDALRRCASVTRLWEEVARMAGARRARGADASSGLREELRRDGRKVHDQMREIASRVRVP